MVLQDVVVKSEILIHSLLTSHYREPLNVLWSPSCSVPPRMHFLALPH